MQRASAVFLDLVDLSWPLRPDMPLFPGDPPLEFQRLGALETHGYLSHLVRLPAHSGTHMDAPGHVLAGGAMLADLPLSRFAGPGALLDLRGRADLAVTAADLSPHLPGLRAQAPAFALLRTGDEARWGQSEYFTHGAHLTPEAAALLAGLDLSGVGLDAGSADPLDAADLPAHKALLGAGTLIVENLRNLEALPARGFHFFCLPVLGGDGSPVRAAALVAGATA
ncbi:MAG: cyclase family protein [Humidesulfovibrio sp.]|nr:cyclase family protein [Humidesulfovibrio sp.]